MDDPGYTALSQILVLRRRSWALDHKGEGCRKNLSLNENILR